MKPYKQYTLDIDKAEKQFKSLITANNNAELANFAKFIIPKLIKMIKMQK